jgi:hypothetical protein
MPDVDKINLFDPTLVMGDEKALLKKHLRAIQQSLLWKVEGLSDEDLRRPMTKTGTNLIGIVKHLTGVTYAYLCSSFGRPTEPIPWEHDEELFHGLDFWATPDDSCEEIIAMYRRASDASMRTIDELDLDTEGRHHAGVAVSLRWMILVVLADTLRHTGHADVVREMIDGRVGAHANDGMSTRDNDEEHLQMMGARRSGEIDRDTWLAYNRDRKRSS